LKSFQSTFRHASEANKYSKAQIGTDAVYKNRIFWKEIHDAWQNALRVGLNNMLSGTKLGTYLEDVVECLPIRIMSGGDSVKMFQIAPPRKYRHSMRSCDQVRNLICSGVKWGVTSV